MLLPIIEVVYIQREKGGGNMRYSDAQKEATARYSKKTYDRINVIVYKGQRKLIKDFAASQGKSLNRFICDAIEAQMGIKLNSKE